jgi:hypothetical protein
MTGCLKIHYKEYKPTNVLKNLHNNFVRFIFSEHLFYSVSSQLTGLRLAERVSPFYL